MHRRVEVAGDLVGQALADLLVGGRLGWFRWRFLAALRWRNLHTALLVGLVWIHAHALSTRRVPGGVDRAVAAGQRIRVAGSLGLGPHLVGNLLGAVRLGALAGLVHCGLDALLVLSLESLGLVYRHGVGTHAQIRQQVLGQRRAGQVGHKVRSRDHHVTAATICSGFLQLLGHVRHK